MSTSCAPWWKPSGNCRRPLTPVAGVDDWSIAIARGCAGALNKLLDAVFYWVYVSVAEVYCTKVGTSVDVAVGYVYVDASDLVACWKKRTL